MHYKVIKNKIEVDGVEFLEGEVFECPIEVFDISELLADGSIEITLPDEPTLPGEDE